MKEFLVLFGAGAEYGYKLPSGAKYTKDTILTKNTTLYEHLEKYYKNRTDENYSGGIIEKNTYFAQIVMRFAN